VSAHHLLPHFSAYPTSADFSSHEGPGVSEHCHEQDIAHKKQPITQVRHLAFAFASKDLKVVAEGGQ
jgi:hypothetical protein